jgi:hypothetical protein
MRGEDIPLPKHGSSGLKAIVKRACEPDPKKRYQTPTDMKNDLAVLKETGAVPVEAIPVKQPTLPKAPEKKAKKAEKKASMPPIPDLINLLTSIIKFFFPSLFLKFHFHVARIKIKVGGADAAKIAYTYYAISNALGPALSFIEKHSNLHGMRRAEIEISPDYLSEEIKADVKLGFSTSIGGILGILIKTGFKALFGYMKIKPSGSTSQNHIYTDKKPEDSKTEEKKPLDSSSESKTA